MTNFLSLLHVNLKSIFVIQKQTIINLFLLFPENFEVDDSTYQLLCKKEENPARNKEIMKFTVFQRRSLIRKLPKKGFNEVESLITSIMPKLLDSDGTMVSFINQILSKIIKFYSIFVF